MSSSSDVSGPVQRAAWSRTPSASDGGELVPVADEGDPGVGFVGDGEQGVCGVLIEHACFVDEEDVARQ